MIFFSKRYVHVLKLESTAWNSEWWSTHVPVLYTFVSWSLVNGIFSCCVDDAVVAFKLQAYDPIAIGKESPKKNPIMNADGLPEFKNITAVIFFCRETIQPHKDALELENQYN